MIAFYDKWLRAGMGKIKNINGAVHYNCACGSWLKHWEKFAGKKAEACAVVNCIMPASIGAHAQKSTTNDEHLYVIPLCEEHAVSPDELEVRDEYKLVSANIQTTCERW